MSAKRIQLWQRRREARIKQCWIYHVDLVVIHQNPCTEQEREEQLVFLEEGPANVAVEAECEEVVDVGNALG